MSHAAIAFVSFADGTDKAVGIRHEGNVLSAADVDRPLLSNPYAMSSKAGSTGAVVVECAIVKDPEIGAMSSDPSVREERKPAQNTHLRESHTNSSHTLCKKKERSPMKPTQLPLGIAERSSSLALDQHICPAQNPNPTPGHAEEPLKGSTIIFWCLCCFVYV